MSLWFNDPFIRSLVPLGASSSMRALSARFNIPLILTGWNVLPEGLTLGPTIIDSINQRCTKKKAFIVTDEFGARFTSKITRVFSNGGYTCHVWDKALPEAPLENIKACSEGMTDFEPDLIIALGGGSVIDSAKAAWILYERTDITDLASITPMELLGLRKKAVLAAIPTTSGTGSECTNASVVNDVENHRKIPIVNADLIPDFAIIMPEFTISMPPKLTAGSGLDALSHAMDAIISPIAGDFTDSFAITAVRNIFEFLPRAYKNGKDREAREIMLTSSMMAGISLSAGTALTHSFGHSLGAFFNLHHGIIVGIFIPYALEFYGDITEKYLKICDALKLEEGPPLNRLQSLITRVKDLLSELNVPLSIKELGIPEDTFEKHLDSMVSYALEDISTVFSPRPMTEEQCKKLFRYAYEGKTIDF